MGGEILNLIALMASILAGFSFSVVVQLALAHDRSPRQQAIRATFVAFLICTIALIIAVAAGVLLILPSLNRPLRGDGILVTLVILGMWIGAVTFGLGLIGLGWIHSKPFGIISTVAGIAFLVLIHVAIQAATAGFPF